MRETTVPTTEKTCERGEASFILEITHTTPLAIIHPGPVISNEPIVQPNLLSVEQNLSSAESSQPSQEESSKPKRKREPKKGATPASKEAPSTDEPNPSPEVEALKPKRRRAPTKKTTIASSKQAAPSAKNPPIIELDKAEETPKLKRQRASKKAMAPSASQAPHPTENLPFAQQEQIAQATSALVPTKTTKEISKDVKKIIEEMEQKKKRESRGLH